MSSRGQFQADRIQVTYRAADATVVETTLDRVTVEAVVTGLPVREFRYYKGRRHYSGWYWSSTMARLVGYESRLELARILLADFDPAVTAIASQPFLLSGSAGRGTKRHVPDLLLTSPDGGVVVVDVKAPSKRHDPKVRAIMEWTREVTALRGWGFEEWYGASPRLLANVAFLAGYRRRTVIDATLIPAILAAVGEGAPIAHIEHTAHDACPALLRPVILHLLGEKPGGIPGQRSTGCQEG